MAKNKRGYKKLIKNVGLMTISSFGSKIMNILLVPLYTSILSTREYGTYDIYATIASLVLPIVTLNVSDAVFRFSMDEKYNKKHVFSIGIRYCIRASLIFALIVFGVCRIGFVSKYIQFPALLLGYFILHMMYEFIVRFIRGLERISDIAIGGLLNTFSLISFNLLFLLKYKMGLKGYFFAIFLSYIIPLIYFTARVKIWNYFSFKYDKKIEREMCAYSFPLLFDCIGWWINNASDRYIVTWICGLSINGIYSVAYKLPSLINTIQNIFNQAWMISAIEEYKQGNITFLKRTYSIYNFILIITCSGMIILDKIFAYLLFSKDFYKAWVYAPFLMIAVVFGGLSAFTEAIFAAAKETKMLAKTTIIGAVFNIVCNIITVKLCGAIGASFSTMISYSVVWMTRVLCLKKELNIPLISIKQIICFVIVITQAFLMSVFSVHIGIISMLTLVILILNITEIRMFVVTIMNKNYK